MQLGPNQIAWVEALESGEYKQTDGFLNMGNAFCCLGVACVVAEKNGVTVNRGRDQRNDEIVGQSLKSQVDVKNWIGLVDDEGGFRSQRDPNASLANLNDNGHTFADIAALIRTCPDGLFTESK